MVLKIAHKGASKYAPENTLEAFNKATKLNVDIVEFDVHLTKDKKVVIMHDHNIKNATGESGWIKNLTLKELKKFHEPNGESVPMLQEVIDILRKYVICKIDIKDKSMHKYILKIIKNNKLKNVIITCDYHSVIGEIKKSNPEIKCAVGGVRDKSVKKAIRDALRVKADIIDANYLIVTKKLIDEAHKNGLEINAWTVDDLKTIKKLKKLGVDAITSNSAWS
ncbi:MAG: glycerophosphodiester phosphodiesterase [Nanoarchaeota archaeon]|nr:glycerophosphodiester phosphodiesterase [Nanoarchaeota archaeon]